MKKKYTNLVKGLTGLVLAVFLVLQGTGEVEVLDLFGLTQSPPEKGQETERDKGNENPHSSKSPANPQQSKPKAKDYAVEEDLTSFTYSGDAYVDVEDGKADFTVYELEEAETSYLLFSELDELGRTGPAIGSVSSDTMPVIDRKDSKSISGIHPSGWKQASYKEVISSEHLYNRCHLIGFQLAGAEEDTNSKVNLVTGTRYMNWDGMVELEDSIAAYIKANPDKHVLYRVSPLYEGDELLCRGIRMEAKSVEDNGKGIDFDVYAFNVQPGVSIDYTDGSSALSD